MPPFHYKLYRLYAPSGGLASLPNGKWAPLHISQWGPLGSCVFKREKGQSSFSSKFPVPKENSKLFHAKPRNIFYARPESNSHTIFILLGGPQQKEKLTPLCKKGAVLGDG
ncbi:hypothetical protein AVEN_47085-1 [Araneus ventricosus]|uniref:Uncharacterized protein n=1 Tax=Araneus ventricosus TaxID=182803 RepID=A0A4Y2LD32_ARAVE|nr:hypothetical protein AVEN_47085-1 [Araneus ventricosus]